MNAEEPWSVLETLRADIAVHEAAVAALREQLAPHEAVVAKLRDFESYLLSKLPSNHTRPPTMPAAPGETDISPGGSGGLPQPKDVSIGTIEVKAEAAIRAVELGATLKAKDIAAYILPHYDPDLDARNFENRVFSVLRRRGKFVKVGRGNWTLREFVNSHPELYPQEEEEPLAVEPATQS